MQPLSSSDAVYRTGIGKLLELDDCITFGDFKAHSPLWQSKLPEYTKGNNIAIKIDPSNLVVLNEKTSKKVKNS